jgi:hypothetical protein
MQDEQAGLEPSQKIYQSILLYHLNQQGQMMYLHFCQMEWNILLQICAHLKARLLDLETG